MRRRVTLKDIRPGMQFMVEDTDYIFEVTELPKPNGEFFVKSLTGQQDHDTHASFCDGWFLLKEGEQDPPSSYELFLANLNEWESK